MMALAPEVRFAPACPEKRTSVAKAVKRADHFWHG
jgi:hypothetical protein